MPSQDEHSQVPPTQQLLGGYPVPELLEKLRTGDQNALAILYAELFGMLWSLAYTQTRSRETAKDVVQDVFLWLWTRRDTMKADTDIRVYLAVAVRNRARNLHRHRRVVEAVEDTVHVTGRDAPAIGHSPPSSDAAVEAREFYVAYHRALATLTERERTAALLRWEESLTLEQISQVLEVSVEGARKVLLRAQAKVQAGLEDYRS